MPRQVPAMTESSAVALTSGNYVDFGTSALLNNRVAWTFLLWCYPTSTLTAGSSLFTKLTAGVNGINFRIATDSNPELRVLRNTSNYSFVASGTPLATLNQWYCMGVTFEQTSNAHLYIGTQIAPLAEVSYSLQQIGSGTFTDDSGNPLRLVGTTGIRYAVAAMFNRVLSLGECRSWQRTALNEPYPELATSGLLGCWYPGWDGPNTVIDYSGNKHTGTISGGTLARGVILNATTPWQDTWPSSRPALSQYMRPVRDIQPSNWIATR